MSANSDVDLRDGTRYQLADLAHWVAQFSALLALFVALFGDFQWLKPDTSPVTTILGCLLGVLYFSAKYYWPYVLPGVFIGYLTFVMLDGREFAVLSRHAKSWSVIVALYAIVVLELAWPLICY